MYIFEEHTLTFYCVIWGSACTHYTLQQRLVCAKLNNCTLSCYYHFFEIYFRTTTGSSTGSYTTTGTRTQTGASANWDSEDDSEEEEEEKQQHRSPIKRESPTPKPATKQKKPVVLPRKSVSFEDNWDDESQVSQSQTQSNWDDTR